MGATVCVCVYALEKQQYGAQIEIRTSSSITLSCSNKNGTFVARAMSVRKFVFMFVLIESQQLEQHIMCTEHAFAHGAACPFQP